MNLVGNAIKFTETGGVRVVLQQDDSSENQQRLRCDVIDTGIGMAAEQTAMLFQPFSQVDASARRRFGGTGLGLAISKRLAGMLGGAIQVVSEANQGSTFSLTIAASPVEESLPPASMPEPPVRPTAQPRDLTALHCRILLAEDGLVNQRLITFVLNKAGAEVVVADNGQTAVDLALAALQTGNPFAVVLMDMQMPIMDGYEATRILRSSRYDRPIIALTAHAMTEDRQKCIDAGCNDYLSKPIDQTLLLDMVAGYACQQASQLA
jgi:CheY-like chemotaxis protein